MTSQELKTKLDAANEKVEKRLNTISKLCKKLSVNKEDLLVEYQKAPRGDYGLRTKDAQVVVSMFTELGEYDESSQLVDNLVKLDEVEKIAKNWQVKYDIQKNKEEAPKIKVLWDFLNEWEEKARNWYIENSKYLVKCMNEFHEIAYKFLEEHNYEDMDYQQKKELVSEFNDYFENNYRITRRYKFSHTDVNDWIRTKNIDNLTKELTDVRFNESDDNPWSSYDQTFGYCGKKGEYFIKSFNLEKLNKILTQEKQYKYEDLCNRISVVIGEIEDVSNLSIGNQNGELNGIVKGTKGTARVETIGCGGYNIQIFHYRVLVHKIN